MDELQQARYNKMISLGVYPEFASRQVGDPATFTGLRESTPQVEKTDSFAADAAGDIKEGFQGIGEAFNARASKFAETTTKEGALAGSIEAVGQGAGLVGDVIGELFTTGLKVVAPEEVEKGVSNFIAEKGEQAANIVNPVTGRTLREEAKNAQSTYESWAKDNPILDASVRAAGNVGQVALELLGFKAGKAAGEVVGKTASEGLADGANVAKEVGQKQITSLKEVFKGGVVPSLDGTIDKAIGSAAGIAGIVRKVPEKIGDSVKDAVTRNLIKTAQGSPEKAQEKILDLYKKGIVPGVKKKNKTIANIKNIDESVKRVVPSLAKKYDPENIEDFANAISAEKKSIYNRIEQGLGKAQGKISTGKIVEELSLLLKSERADLSDELKRSTQGALDNLLDAEGNAKLVSPEGAQQIIADIHAELQSFYRGSTTAKNSDVVVKNLVLNNLKKDLDDLVEGAGGEFKGLKSQYADLKKLEDDVVHRAVFEAQKGSGLQNITDVFSAGDVLGGAIGGNPAFLAKGVGQYFTKEVVAALNDKNELVRQMFVLGKNISIEPSPKSK